MLLALGVRWRRLEAAGADRFDGAGIYYACTTVEADLYDGADVAVVGGGNSAGQAVMFLAECCPTRNVHLLIRRTLGPGMSEYLSQPDPGDRQRGRPRTDRDRGDPRKPSHRRDHAEIATSARTARLPCSAVFVFIGAEPAADWLPAEIARDANGYLLTGHRRRSFGIMAARRSRPCPLETTLPGVLAAGDIRSGSTKRVGFAVGDGSLAVTCAHRLLSISR